jgi:hypothetical protein
MCEPIDRTLWLGVKGTFHGFLFHAELDHQLALLLLECQVGRASGLVSCGRDGHPYGCEGLSALEMWVVSTSSACMASSADMR